MTFVVDWYFKVYFFVFIAAEKQGNKSKNGETQQNKQEPTWVEELFQGTFTNETRCLNCETVSYLHRFR